MRVLQLQHPFQQGQEARVAGVAVGSQRLQGAEQVPVAGYAKGQPAFMLPSKS